MDTLWLLARGSLLVLGILAFARKRSAYIGYVVCAALWIPARAGFHGVWRPCEWHVPLAMAVHSLTNYPHIILFAIFFVMTWIQFRDRPVFAFAIATVAVLAMGALVEWEEGFAGTGHCRIRDLIPDSVGALVGATLAAVAMRFRVWPSGELNLSFQKMKGRPDGQPDAH